MNIYEPPNTKLSRIRRTWSYSTSNSATTVYRLCLVLQLSSIGMNGTAIPHTTCEQVRCYGGEKSSHIFVVLHNCFKSLYRLFGFNPLIAAKAQEN